MARREHDGPGGRAGAAQLEVSAVPRGTAAAHIAEQLARRIVSGELTPGDRLPPLKELAVQFGVSVGTVREAVSGLAHAGQLEAMVGKGTFVRQVPPGDARQEGMVAWSALPESEADFLEFLEARRELEALLSRFAAQRATADQVDGLRRLVAACRAAAAQLEQEPGNPEPVERLNEADTAFHDAVAAAAQNGPLRQALYLLRSSLRGRFARLRRSLSRGEIDRWAGVQLHERLVDAIAAHDEEAAFAVAREIVDLTISWHLKLGPA